MRKREKRETGEKQIQLKETIPFFFNEENSFFFFQLKCYHQGGKQYY